MKRVLGIFLVITIALSLLIACNPVENKKPDSVDGVGAPVLSDELKAEIESSIIKRKVDVEKLNAESGMNVPGAETYFADDTEVEIVGYYGEFNGYHILLMDTNPTYKFLSKSELSVNERRFVFENEQFTVYINGNFLPFSRWIKLVERKNQFNEFLSVVYERYYKQFPMLKDVEIAAPEEFRLTEAQTEKIIEVYKKYNENAQIERYLGEFNDCHAIMIKDDMPSPIAQSVVVDCERVAGCDFLFRSSRISICKGDTVYELKSAYELGLISKTDVEELCKRYYSVGGTDLLNYLFNENIRNYPSGNWQAYSKTNPYFTETDGIEQLNESGENQIRLYFQKMNEGLSAKYEGYKPFEVGNIYYYGKYKNYRAIGVEYLNLPKTDILSSVTVGGFEFVFRREPMLFFRQSLESTFDSGSLYSFDIEGIYNGITGDENSDAEFAALYERYYEIHPELIEYKGKTPSAPVLDQSDGNRILLTVNEMSKKASLGNAAIEKYYGKFGECFVLALSFENGPVRPAVMDYSFAYSVGKYVLPMDSYIGVYKEGKIYDLGYALENGEISEKDLEIIISEHYRSFPQFMRVKHFLNKPVTGDMLSVMFKGDSIIKVK